MDKSLQLIQITPEELQQSILSGVKACLDELKDSFQTSQPKDLLSREETAELLGIDLSTLYRWTQQGKLNSYGIGNRVFYKREEIEKSLVPLNNSYCKVNHSNLDVERVSTTNKVQQ